MTQSEDEKSRTLADLKPMFDEARSSGKWFWCNYQDLWFSPDQLAAAQASGRFIWGSVNWKLRDPAERIEEAKKRRDAAQADVDRVINQTISAIR